MRITYIHQHFRPPGESGGARPYEFARRLAAAGHDVTVIAGGATSRTYSLEGFRVVQLTTAYDNSMSMARRMLAFAQFMVLATWSASRYRADVVFASSTPLTVAVPGMIAAVARRARFVLEIRDLWPMVPIELGFLPSPLHGPARLLERIAYRRADEIVALSPWMAEGVRAVDPAARVTMIPNACDNGMRPTASREAVRARYDVAEETILFGYAGSLGVVYDAGWLADLAESLEQAGARLVVAGDGSERRGAMRALADRGIDAERVFVGPISRTEVFDLLHAADVAVSSIIEHPLLEHASINKVFDALATGTPVVFNHGGWLYDVVTECSAGWRWPRALDPTDVAARVAELTPKTLGEAGAAAACLGEERFDREHLFEEFAEVLCRPRKRSRQPDARSGDARPHVRLHVQPRVSHYREPLIGELLESPNVRYDLFGITADGGPDKIRSAGRTTLSAVDGIRWTSLGPLRWDHGVVSSVVWGRHDAYVLEGRIYTASTWVALICGRLLRRPVFLWTHGWKRPERGIKRSLRTAFYRLSPGLLLYGEGTKERAVEYGLAEDSLAVVGNSIYSRATVERWARSPFLDPAPEAFTIIVACRLTARHKIELLLESLDRLTDLPPIQVVVVGDGSERQRLEDRASRSRAHARFVGAVYDDHELARLYALADLAASPAASGLNVVQALGFGVPVVAPDHDPSAGPEHELVIPGETGYRFRHGDVDDLAAVLRRAIIERHELVELGARGRAVVLTSHVADAHARAFDTALTRWGVVTRSAQ